MKKHTEESEIQTGTDAKKISPILMSTLRIILAVIILTGVYTWGVWNGLGVRGGYPEKGDGKYSRHMEKHEEQKPLSDMSDPMREHCQMMPEMAGCEGYQGESGTTMTHDMMDMSMRDMGTMLQGLSGSALDKAFLESMIPHHQGAIDMAKYLAGSDKPELVKLGADIISAQTAEIEQMQKWLKEWGYTK